jgi:hypothetical protein
LKYPDVLAYYAYSWAVMIASPATDVSFMPPRRKKKAIPRGWLSFLGDSVIAK